MNLQQRRTATKVVFGTLVGIVFLVTAGFVIRFVISSTIISRAKGQAKTIVEQAKKQAESEKNRVESETRDAELRRTETIKALDQQINDTGAELRNRDQAISVKGQQLKELEEKVATVSANNDKDQQIKSRLTEIDKLNNELASTKIELEKIKSRKDQVQMVDRRVEDLQKIKDLEAKLQKLGQQQLIALPTSSGNKNDELESNMVFAKTMNQLIKPLVDEINQHPPVTQTRGTGVTTKLNHQEILYNRMIVQGALNNCQRVLWNLSSIETAHGKKYRAYIAQASPRISEPVAFDIKYDDNGPYVRFNREILNHILFAAGDENVDIMTLNKTFQDSFSMFMNPHFVDTKQIDDWQLSETIATADKQLYSLYHR